MQLLLILRDIVAIVIQTEDPGAHETFFWANLYRCYGKFKIIPNLATILVSSDGK